MPPGRKRKPTHLKLIDGNPGKRKLEPAPKVPPQRPIAPSTLSEEARKEWQYVVPRLDEVGMLTKVDRTALEVYCEAVATHREAIGHLRELGILVRGDKGRVVKNPAAQLARDAATTIRLFCSEFGLTPSSRMRMDVPGMSDGGISLDEILGG